MNNIYDLIVIGGGAAGMMTAGTAGACGAKVLLLEKNNKLGKKILISGHERCNITHHEFNIRELIKAYDSNGNFLFSVLHSFGPKEIMDFFEDHNLPLKIQSDDRVFPASDKSEDVVIVLEKFLEDNNVKIKFNTEIKNIKKEKNGLFIIELKNKEKISSKNLVIATGGLSYPGTGSTGDGYIWAKKFGHKIIPTRPSLVPLKVKEKFVEQLSGLSLSNVEVILYQNNKKKTQKTGDLLFTHFGISGPIILNISRFLPEKFVNTEIRINILPDFNKEKLDILLQTAGKKAVKNIWQDFLPNKLVSIILNLAGIEADKQAGNINKEERKTLLNILQNFSLTIIGDMGYGHAIVTGGGVDLKEINPKTMESKLVDNLYFAGEILDIEGITGGYNLTAAFSTGYTAGENIKF